MKQMIDLSLELYEGMPKFWGDYHAPVKVSITGTYEKNKCLVRKLEMATHSGTHIDAPAHFFAGATTIDKVPPERFIGRTVVVDLRDIWEGDTIEPSRFSGYELGPDVGVLLATRWHTRWSTGEFYKDFPVLSPDAAAYLADARVKFVAVDIPLGVDAHRILLGRGIPLIENLTNLDAVTAKEVTLVALPLKLRDGDAAPARVVAF